MVVWGVGGGEADPYLTEQGTRVPELSNWLRK